MIVDLRNLAWKSVQSRAHEYKASQEIGKMHRSIQRLIVYKTGYLSITKIYYDISVAQQSMTENKESKKIDLFQLSTCTRLSMLSWHKPIEFTSLNLSRNNQWILVWLFKGWNISHASWTLDCFGESEGLHGAGRVGNSPSYILKLVYLFYQGLLAGGSQGPLDVYISAMDLAITFLNIRREGHLCTKYTRLSINHSYFLAGCGCSVVIKTDCQEMRKLKLLARWKCVILLHQFDIIFWGD